MRIFERLSRLLSAKSAPNFGSVFITSDHDGGGLWSDVAGMRGPIYENSAVMGCMAWFMDTLPEAMAGVFARVGDENKPIAPHPFLELVKRPHPDFAWSDLVGAAGVSLALDGNAYWRKRQTQGGQMQLDYVPHTLCEPKAAHGQESQGVAAYVLRVNGRYEQVDRTEIIHFRSGIDPQNTLKGLSRAKAAFREIITDNEASVYNNVILKNLGILGWVISPGSPDSEFSPDQAKEIQDRILRHYTGEERGKPLVLGKQANVSAVGNTPDKMQSREIRLTPEERICAVFRVPPMVVGLAAGLERSTFSNMKEARQMAVESANCPIWMRMADRLTRELSDPAAPVRLLKPNEFIQFDLSTVRALQEDEDAKHTRAQKNFAVGIWKRSESRSYTGKEAGTDDEIYITDIKAAAAQDALLAAEASSSQQRAKVYAALDGKS